MTSKLAVPKISGDTTTAGRGKRPRPPFGVSVVSIIAVLIALFSLVPLAYVTFMTASTGWDTAAALIIRPRVGELLLNTVLLTVATVPLCLILGVGGAWLVERTNLMGRKWWAVLLAAPLAQGRVQRMLRPEQIRISEDGPIRGTVVSGPK